MIRRKVYLEKDEKLFSITEIEQREFGNGDRKGRAKKAAARRDRQKTRARYEANAGKMGISKDRALIAANADMAEEGVKASKQGSLLSLPVKQPGSTPKHSDPKPSGKVLKQIEGAKNIPAKVENPKIETGLTVIKKKATNKEAAKTAKKVVSNKSKGFFNQALNAVKTNKKVQAGLAATAVTGAAIGTGMAIRKHKKDDSEENV